MKYIQRILLSAQWGQVCDVALRVVIWLLLGSVINLIPIISAYLTKAGAPEGNRGYSLTIALSSGDLLLAATVMLPPALADLALNVRKAKRTRVLVVIFGALLSFFSLLIYGYAFANNLARESGGPTVASNLSRYSVANLSVGFFLGAVFIGAICAGFLANEGSPNSQEDASGSREEPVAQASPDEETATASTPKEEAK